MKQMQINTVDSAVAALNFVLKQSPGESLMKQPALTTPGRYPGSRFQWSLKQAWDEHRLGNPKASTRDIAAALNVSEATLVATGCGENVTRLAATWFQLFRLLEVLGPVMAVTRNDHAVHTKIGCYRNVPLSSKKISVQGDVLDLRLRLRRWGSGFAVEEANCADLTRYSLQFFGSDGTSVHKAYLTKHSDLDAYRSLVSAFKAPDQSPVQVVPAGFRPIERFDDRIDVQRLREHWRKLRAPHDFHHLLNEFGVSRIQALRLAGPECAVRISPDLFRELMQTVAEIQLPVMVSVKSKGVIQTHSGPIQNPGVTAPWFTVRDDDFSLRVNEQAIASLWVVNRPVVVGTLTSLELYDVHGKNIAQVLGLSKPGQGQDLVWRDLMAALPGLEGVCTPGV